MAPSWKYTLNYETKWMSRDELVDITYEAAGELNRLKLEHGLLSRREAERVAGRIRQERKMVSEIDRIVALPDEEEQEAGLRELMLHFDTVGPSTICGKGEMNWPTGLFRFNPLRVIRRALTGNGRG